MQGRVSGNFEVEPIAPLEAIEGLDPAKIALGRELFYDVRLSKDGSTSCASCHDFSDGGDDGRPVAVGISGKPLDFNAPSWFNAGYNFSQFWDGRAATLEEQVDGPLLHPDEMASNWSSVLEKLSADETYAARFSDLYDGVTADAVRDAIATFERSLVTLDAPFDRYLRGDAAAISKEAKRGYKLFKSYGCASCHQGRLIGGNLYQKLGVVKPYYVYGETDSDAYKGRAAVSGVNEDRYVFKVPSLRNVELTAPYLHDGSISTLDNVVNIMSAYQLGKSLKYAEVTDIVEFLKTLTGKTPESVK
jgi:cytochrome c peroxidase